MLFRGRAGVGFEAEDVVVHTVDILEEGVDQADEVLRAEEGRGAAADMQLLDVQLAGEHVEVHLPLLDQGVDVWLLEGVILGTMGVAAAEVAMILAVRDMDVHADAGLLVALVEALHHGVLPLLLADAVGAPGGNGGIAGVTGTGITVL
jgi:hypothetical protein